MKHGNDYWEQEAYWELYCGRRVLHGGSGCPLHAAASVFRHGHDAGTVRKRKGHYRIRL